MNAFQLMLIANQIKLLNQAQDREASNYEANNRYSDIVADMLKYARSYNVTNAQAVYDFDFPVSNVNLLRLQKEGYLTINSPKV